VGLELCSGRRKRQNMRAEHFASARWGVYAKRSRSGNPVALGEIDSDIAQCSQNVAVLNELSNSALPHYMADMVDHLYHCAIDRVVQHVFDESAVDLQKIDRKMLQVA